ncbi:hypothetical protein [Paraferrimonas haliotis]|uniref:Uncharacterized protein n=1 Tax=Paraferrimonas haliotis TaxID=2013866 RepID=A0AA37WWA0_9GAMM|nr:hypothetical protein [Paraferrimonas haliotis]GLS83192.1 hypothetical protein GCM10007894_11690 [Paraferrimonas haliotis]
MISLAVLAGLMHLSYIDDRRVIECNIQNAEQCVQLLPDELAHNLLQRYPNWPQDIGYRQAVSYVFDNEHVAGMILLANPHRNQVYQQWLGSDWYTYEAADEAQLVRWHELGHVYARNQISALPELPEVDGELGLNVALYQQEILADLYVAWRIAVQHQDWPLLNQQIHRRNLAMMKRDSDVNHWSVPWLLPLLSIDPKQVAQLDYPEFSKLALTLVKPIDKSELLELLYLFRREFSDGATTPSNKRYLSWRRAQFGTYVEPTLVELMGKKTATKWTQLRYF